MTMWWSKRDPAVFWSWFEANRSQAQQTVDWMQSSGGHVDHGQLDRRLEPIRKALSKYDKRLAFEIGRMEATGEYNLVVTAEGDEAAFASVFALFKAAPRLPGWHITPLKPRRPDGHVHVQVGATTVSTESFRFHHQPDESAPGKSTLLFLVTGEQAFLHEHWDLFQQLGRLAAQAQLGEHDLARYVSLLAVVRLDAFQARWRHDGRPIGDLQDAFPPLPMH